MVRLLFILLLSQGVAWAANDLSRSPMLVDTAATIRTSGIRITSLRWVNVSAAGHKLILSDSEGRKIFETTCPTGASEYELPLPIQSQRGLVVTQIDSGLLYIGYE